MERTLDRLVSFDERSRAYPIRALLADAEPVTKHWPLGVWNDQGAEGACVGFAWSHELAAEPVAVVADDAFARRVYREAQRIDEWPGERYEGTSVLAGAKIAAAWGFVPEYRWAFGVDDLVLAVGHAGPAVIGVNWYSGMFGTDAGGWLRVTGSVSGGHAIVVTGIEVVRRADGSIDRDASHFVLHNSWGRSWGDGGRARLSIADMARLLGESGEACVPVTRAVGAAPSPFAQWERAAQVVLGAVSAWRVASGSSPRTPWAEMTAAERERLAALVHRVAASPGTAAQDDEGDRVLVAVVAAMIGRRVR